MLPLMKSDPTFRRHVRALLDALDRASAAIADAQRARAALARAGRAAELRVFGGHEPEGGEDADGRDQP
jgi:hypothetical protein